MPRNGLTHPPPTADELRALVVPATSADGAAMQRVLHANGISCRVLRNVAAVCEAMRDGVGAVVIAEEALIDDAALLTERIRAQDVWSDLPIIVLSPSGREPSKLAELIPRLGNVSVIERPARTSTLVTAIRSSLRARARQYEVRAHLADQDETQRVIREAEQRFRLLVENVRDYAIFMIDVEGRVASWNSGAEQLLGYTAQEALGQPAAWFFDDQGATLAREMKDARSIGRATSSGWRVRKDAGRLFVEGVLTAVRDDRGRLIGYSKLMKDVTDRRRIEAEREQLLQSERAARSEAERSGRMKDEFLATLGHELRTPLNAILGWAQVLRHTHALDGELAEGLGIIERNARAQAQIIADLLDMSSIISGKVHLEVQPVDLASIVESAVNAVRPAAQAKSIRLDVAIDGAAGKVRGDPNRLQQVFWNLLTNAVKFTPQEGAVAVTLGQSDSSLKVSVVDTGEGIDPAFLPHVFERFRQADASTTRRHGGLGLGLSIVRQLVELHGGTVTAFSDGAGKGSTFQVVLPLPTKAALPVTQADPSQPRRSPPLHAEMSPAPNANLQGVKVLVVDDEADARSLIERLLHDCDATVTTAASAKEALDVLARDRPDVLISDIGMPKEDGYSLMRRIRRLKDERGRLPAIALTAYARVEDRVKAMEAGYQLHLAKPIEASTLIAMVATLSKRERSVVGRPH
jgi:PAS domain S-box-containing protein